MDVPIGMIIGDNYDNISVEHCLCKGRLLAGDYTISFFYNDCFVKKIICEVIDYWLTTRSLFLC